MFFKSEKSSFSGHVDHLQDTAMAKLAPAESPTRETQVGSIFKKPELFGLVAQFNTA